MEFEDTELAIVRDKWNQLVRETDVDYPPSEDASNEEWQWGSSRLDVIRLQPFVEGVDPRSEVRGRNRVDDALELFWSQHFPQREEVERRTERPRWRRSRHPAEQLSREHERLMLECLEFLEKRHRVRYVEDEQPREELEVYLHIAAARAIRLKQSEGLSEEVQTCLSEVERTVKRLGGARVLAGNAVDYPAYETSLNAVSAISFVEWSRVKIDDGNYVEALHHLAEAAICYDEAVAVNGMPEESRYYYEDEDAEDLKAIEFRLRSILKSHLTGLHVSLEEAKTIFELIRVSASSVSNWTQVAQDCKTLADARNVSGVEDEAKGQYGGTLTWSEYWHSARAWASAQLSSSEYRKMRDADQREDAENRLKNYFFGHDWQALPKGAQERLISADVNWNSRQRMAREAILNDLLRATEEMCYEFIWKPLSESRESSLEFLKFEARAIDRHSTPSSRHYVDLCKQRFLHDHLRRLKLAEEEFRLLMVILPNLLEQLIDRRNPAEHEPGNPTSREVVEDCYKTFLGIGKRGVLPEFARIGRRLRGGRRGTG